MNDIALCADWEKCKFAASCERSPQGKVIDPFQDWGMFKGTEYCPIETHIDVLKAIMRIHTDSNGEITTDEKGRQSYREAEAELERLRKAVEHGTD